jgi:peptidoglycan/xylan/chitin deacetylase (PgdA/CDA1 family)
VIREAIAWWQRRGPGALILVYHRVTHLARDRWSIAVTPDRFEHHMALLRREANPIPLARIDGVLDGGTIPANAVVVTFDDGYADNLHDALPVLRRHEIPATVFVAPDAVLSGSEFWWDDLERIIHGTARLPPVLELVLRGETRRWDVPDPDVVSEPDPTLATPESMVAKREALYDSLWRELRDATAAERKSAIATLRSLTGGDAGARTTHRPLNCEELRRLADDPLIEIGAHTASHARLAALTCEEQRREIDASREALETLTGRPVTSFAYPFGRAADYTDETMQLIRQAGFARACINQAGRVDRSTDRFALPRLFVREWDDDRFAAALREHGVRV